MATRFDQLQSRSRPTGADLYSPDLLGYSRGATPPYVSPQEQINRRFPGTFDFLPGSQEQQDEIPKRLLGPTRERYGDPTKIITQGLPPSLNAPYGARGLDQLQSMRMARAGLSYDTGYYTGAERRGPYPLYMNIGTPQGKDQGGYIPFPRPSVPSVGSRYKENE